MRNSKKVDSQKPPDSFSEPQSPAGKNLQIIRKKRGFTQKGLAKYLGMTRAAVTSYETGRSRLTDTVLAAFCGALQVSADEILGLQKEPVPGFNRKWIKRLKIVEGLPPSIKKHILRALDDLIKANTRLSIFDDE
ncbi:MAG: helix-turn-helix domain-containing protein [Treponema sp.]|jgi:transcriptional regulator with XRE-family HTH domain|nr:helix-turn-helix domain-containing protein [Treponema sp.]